MKFTMMIFTAARAMKKSLMSRVMISNRDSDLFSNLRNVDTTRIPFLP